MYVCTMSVEVLHSHMTYSLKNVKNKIHHPSTLNKDFMIETLYYMYMSVKT